MIPVGNCDQRYALPAARRHCQDGFLNLKAMVCRAKTVMRALVDALIRSAPVSGYGHLPCEGRLSVAAVAQVWSDPLIGSQTCEQLSRASSPEG
jgi:hypothetical protein